MKRTLSKQRFLLMVVVCFVLLVGGVYLLINGTDLKFLGRNVDKYSELIEFCDIKRQTGDDLYFDCYAFLDSEFVGEGGANCIEFVTPYFNKEGTMLRMQLCEKEDKIAWENPYSNYSLHIPVVMTFKYRRSSLLSYNFESLGVELMEDEKASELWDLIVTDLFGPRYYKAFRSSGHKLTEELGYSITAKGDPNDMESIVRDGIVIYSTRINSYEVEGNKILLKMEAFVDGRDRTLTFTTEEFSLLESTGEREGVLIDASNIAGVDLNAEYQARFKFIEEGSVTEGFVEEQLALLTEGKESELLFDMISVIHEG